MSILASLLDVTDKQLEAMQEQFKEPQGQALQLLKKWRANTHGTRQQLYDLLAAAEYHEAAKMWKFNSFSVDMFVIITCIRLQ